jgi:heme exporter protein B
MSGFFGLIRRDLRLALRQGTDAAVAVLFFVVVLVLVPLGVGPEPQLLARIAPGLVWIAALLAVLLSLERMFQSEFEDGSLDQLALSALPLEAVVLAKVTAGWLTTGLPLLVAAPVLATMLGLPAEALPALLASLALGTPILSLIGAVGAALTVGARRGGVLLALVVLPLYVPALIFASGAVDAAASGMAVRPHLLLLAGCLALALPLAPIAAAAALRDALH